MKTEAQIQARKAWRKEYMAKNREKLYAQYREFYKKNRDTKSYFVRRRRDDTNLSSCALGLSFEKKAMELLKGAIHENAEQESKKPWDIVWNGKKIDVKVRNKHKQQKGWGAVVKNQSEVDYYLVFCLLSEKIDRIYLIPSGLVGRTLRISQVSDRYEKYRITGSEVL